MVSRIVVGEGDSRGAALGAGARILPEGEADNETTALGAIRLHGDGAAIEGHGVMDDGESQTAAAALAGAGLIHPVEAGEDMGQILRGDADAGVRRLQNGLAVPGKEAQGDAAVGDIVFEPFSARLKITW